MTTITFTSQDLARQTELLSQAVAEITAVIADHDYVDYSEDEGAMQLDGLILAFRTADMQIRNTQREALQGGDVDAEALDTLAEAYESSERANRLAANAVGNPMSDHHLGMAIGCQIVSGKLRNILS